MLFLNLSFQTTYGNYLSHPMNLFNLYLSLLIHESFFEIFACMNLFIDFLQNFFKTYPFFLEYLYLFFFQPFFSSYLLLHIVNHLPNFYHCFLRRLSSYFYLENKNYRIKIHLNYFNWKKLQFLDLHKMLLVQLVLILCQQSTFFGFSKF